eukprot:TRINITY_DN2569_c0_g1_i1.p1 TRINITY_DN2569_c0_g1~~TRINITY_DN2569_c0_g1_i1.p1  ORF type:complete len:277 (+),score=59.65 TRINITY_DN2569_c0_g1_i1:1094-1924(+)
MRDLKHSYKVLDHGTWSDLPVLFTNHDMYLDPANFPGFISIPLDFKVHELKMYLERNIPTIRRQRREIRNTVQSITFLQEQLQLRIDLNLVTYKLSSLTDVQEGLELILGVVDELDKFNLAGLTLVLSGDQEIPEINWKEETLYIPVPVDIEVLLFFLESHSKEFSIRFLKSTRTQEHRKRVMELCTTMARLLGAKRVLIGNSLSGNSFVQLVGLLNIRRLLVPLKEQGLEGWTLVLGTGWNIDMAKRIFHVPFEFGMDEWDGFLARAGKIQNSRE